MVQRAVPVDVKLQAMFARGAADGRVWSVTALCLELGISRQSYYKYRRRFADLGVAGLVEQSRRPLRSPGQTPDVVEQAIVVARKELAEEGWDNGASSIRFRLLAEGVPAPSVRTVHRVLVRRGLVEAAPAKRPRSALRRFVFPATDDCWQIDAMETSLADGTVVVVFQILDDHSRYEVGNLAWPQEDGVGAWTCMKKAIGEYGQPRMALSDNGLAFSGARRGSRVAFECNLRALGIRPITSTPHHPQTCGKNERSHLTLQRWLAARPTAATLAELQDLLDSYRQAYNQHRPHQALSGRTPAEARAQGVRVAPCPVTADYPTITKQTVVDARGNAHCANAVIAVGSENIGLTLDAFITGQHVLLFHRDRLVRDLIIDPSRKLQPHRPDHRRRRGRRYARHADIGDIGGTIPSGRSR